MRMNGMHQRRINEQGAGSTMSEKKEPSPKGLKKWFSSGDWIKSFQIQLLLYAIFGIAFYLLLLKHVLPEQYHIEAGMVSPVTIVSPVTKIDQAATEEAKNEAASQVEQVYTKDSQITISQINKLDQFFAELRKILNDSSLEQKDKRKKIEYLTSQTISKKFSDQFYEALSSTTPEKLTQIRLKTRDIVHAILEDGVRKSEINEMRDQVDRRLVTMLLDQNVLDSQSNLIVREIAKESIVANEFYDKERTEALREQERDSVPPIFINKGQIIVSTGEVVTPDQYRQLNELGLLKKQTYLWQYIGLALFVFILLFFMYWYIRYFHKDLRENNKLHLMLFSILLLTLLGMKVVALIQNPEWNMLGYLAPVGLGAMLITLLLNVELGIGSVIVLSIASSVFFNGNDHLLFDYRYGFVSFVGGVACCFALSSVQKRSAILRAGVMNAFASMLAIVALYFLMPSVGNLKELMEALSFGILSGIFSAVLTMGFLPYFESVFDILSPMRLLELSNPNHPLLRKLLIETPGTYHHSIIVGNLAEAAAAAIGADGLLARVGAYYHDVGKTKRPQFFIENQINRENPHDRISPHLSKTIIISHARDGVELLKQYQIPKPIQDIAAQHHGTTLLKYFYYKAMEQQGCGQVLEEDFRYPGPKAQFKEAAIVGICDCVEAAVRSLSKPTPSRIENMVKKIIQERLEDGQFDECDLTLKELNLIAKSVCETLQGIFHSRIEYPEEPAATKGVKNG